RHHPTDPARRRSRARIFSGGPDLDLSRSRWQTVFREEGSVKLRMKVVMLHSASVDDPRIGRVVAGRYKLLEALAEGGMGVVYRAERVGIGGPVVVKFLHAMLSEKAGIVDRFEREARATALLNHPNCVALVDFGLDEGAPFLVMELAEGQTLADFLDHGPLPP